MSKIIIPMNRPLWLLHTIKRFLPFVKTSHTYNLQRDHYGTYSRFVAGVCRCGAKASQKDLDDCEEEYRKGAKI